VWGGRISDATKPEVLTHYAVRHLERLPLVTPARIGELVSRLEKQAGRLTVVADVTGVGAPVFDMLKSAELKPTGIFIHGGDAVTRDGSIYRVS